MMLDEVAACDAELEALTIQLERARQKKAALARERELREEAQAAARQNTTPNGPLHMQSTDDLQRQIDELKRQLAAQELELQTAVTIGTSYATEDNEDANRGNDTSCKMPQRHSTIKECHNTDPNQPPVRPTRHAEEAVQAASRTEENLSPVQSPKSAVGSSSSSPYAATSPPPCKGASELAKEKHNWEKPAWALPSTVVHTDESILTDSIQHGLKKPTTSGNYERKVHATETLELIKGTFVAPQTKLPDPRMVWIVLNVDGSKVGKIVMHLYGNFLPLVDIFLELKGLELKNNAGGATGQWYVDDIDPAFYVHHGPASTFKGPSSACFGTVLEGHDVLQTINQAAPSGAVVTIKQSHIFPVKKAKS
jgi:hypothetical protein